MKKLIYLFLSFLIWQCSLPQNQTKSEPVFFYDSERILEVNDFKEYIDDQHSDSTLVHYIFRKSVKTPKYIDTFLTGYNYKYYHLMFYFEYYKDGRSHNDTSFTKPISYLNQIKYFDSKWFENEEKVDSFWTPIKCWRCSGIYDTTKIYLILPVERTDSVIFFQVHREYYESVD